MLVTAVSAVARIVGGGEVFEGVVLDEVADAVVEHGKVVALADGDHPAGVVDGDGGLAAGVDVVVLLPVHLVDVGGDLDEGALGASEDDI